MIVDVIATAQQVTPARTAGRAVAVIDVFRATSVVVEALANGAGAVIPVADIGQARKRAAGFEAGSFLLAGERNAVRIEGFDLGNSPRSFDRATVAGKTVIQTTTNGTLALTRSADAIGSGSPPVLVAAMLNVTAAAGALAASGRDVVLVCSGREGEFTMEDGLCAGIIANILAGHGFSLTDMALAMADIAGRHGGEADGFLRGTKHYRYLTEKGFGDDIRFCLRQDIYQIVPRLRADGSVTL